MEKANYFTEKQVSLSKVKTLVCVCVCVRERGTAFHSDDL